jgi:flagellar biosynthetic protein FlhB
MAEEDSSQEKTEEATPRRQEKAREEGQVPRSRDLTTTAVLLMGSIALLIFGGNIAERMLFVMRFNFSLEPEVIFDKNMMFRQLGESFYEALFSLVPFLSIVVFAALVGPVMLGGWLFSTKALAPKMDRMSLIKGVGRMFSAKSLVELVKSVGKVAVVIFSAFFLLQSMRGAILGLTSEPIERAIAHSLHLSIWAAILLSAATLIIAAIDIPFQIYDHSKKLKMSRQDIRDEMKDTEGKPEVKGKMRQMQQEMARSRMMSAVPEADVVITNPTHYSIALKYNPEFMTTPIVLAKGVDQVAMKIREVANKHKIEFVEAPLLARAIYNTTDLDEEIPAGLYLAVAQVLAYVFQLREYRKGRGERPSKPRKLNIPDDMQHY